jgi:hypothetical protein
MVDECAAMSTIQTEISIRATPEKVWGILTDFSSMPSWNPFIRAISGSATTGNRLSVTLSPPGQSAVTVKPTVLVAEPNRELRWLGTILNRWIFAGEHYFLLQRTSDGATWLTHGERFSGLLAPLVMRGRLLSATKEGFAAMNEALKRQSE